MIVTEELLKPISEEFPCGEDLSNDASLQELETMARGKEETQFSAAEPPDWKQLRVRCLELFGQSKDLRIAMTLAVASIELDGLPGLRDSLTLVKGLLETYWTTFYPQLDPADDNDPLQRMNIVASLATPIGTFGDPLRILERLRAIPLCNSIQLGRFNLTDIFRAESGLAAGSEKPAVATARIDAAFQDSNPEELAKTYQVLGDCITLVQAIDESVTRAVGAGNAPDLTPLAADLSAMRSRVAPYIKESAALAVGTDVASAAAGQEAVGQVASSSDGEIRSRKDVLLLLQKIALYYDRVEPSSPVPLILKRAARLVEMDFMQILEDLSPDAIAQVRTITGEKEE
jgi:type VI secretion system protein ImpA